MCFRARGRNGANIAEVDELNEGILEAINRSGEIFMSHTRLNGAFTLRLAVGNLHTTEHHVRHAWDLLRAGLHEAFRLH